MMGEHQVRRRRDAACTGAGAGHTPADVGVCGIAKERLEVAVG